jgi:hypothetical protein
MGTLSKSKEKSTTSATETSTPQYQSYAGAYATGAGDPALQAYQRAMTDYGNIESGYNPMQQQLWSQIGQQALNQYGTQGPAAMAANTYLQPYMGQGYMNTLNPYFQKQQQYIEQAMPQQKQQFLQELKNQFGPAWGTHGRALDAASNSYANFMASQADKLANLYGQQGTAAQAGMNYTAQNAPTFATMANPFTWGQQAIGWAGAPEAATSEALKAQQQLALGWSAPITQLATLGYQYPTSTTTQGAQTSRGETSGKSAGMSCCFIMNETGDLTDDVRWARDLCYTPDCDVANGYRKMAKWLVPRMQKSPVMKFAVKWTMTHPIAKVAEVRRIDKHQPALYPIGLFWEAVWRMYGMPSEDRKNFNYVIKQLARSASF